MSRRLGLWICIAGIAAFASPARGQPEEDAAAQALFEEGVAAFARVDYPAARRAFRGSGASRWSSTPRRRPSRPT
ncbi:MAG: hypothetical protein QME96_17485, partial [Myxococcota bacterium]|nr:hypothetical protein [Myxococcota bacterium]